jgi:DNA-binding response OmpR family regulator
MTFRGSSSGVDALPRDLLASDRYTDRTRKCGQHALMHADEAPPRVLITEDHLDTREMYACYLRTRGFRVLQAANGRQALVRARRFRPAVIVVDLSLPVLGACQLIEQLRTEVATQSIPIIGLNGFGYQQYSERAMQAGCRCVLIKPCLPDVLADEIELALRSEEASRGRPTGAWSPSF